MRKWTLRVDDGFEKALVLLDKPKQRRVNSDGCKFTLKQYTIQPQKT